MKLWLIIYFLIKLTLVYGEVDNIEKLKEQIYSHEINVTNITVDDFLIFLSKESKISLIPTNRIKNDELSLYIDKNKKIIDILDIFCTSNNYILKDKGSYILVEEKNAEKENRGELLGQAISLDYKENLNNVKITILDENIRPCYSSKEGVFKIKDIPYGAYFVRAEKEGYKIAGEIVDINKKNNIIKISLEREYDIKNDRVRENKFVVEKLKVGDLENIKIEEILSDELKKNIKFMRDNKKNILYISGKKEEVEKVRSLLEEITHSNKEIRISAQIIDITDNLFDELGFSWVYADNKKEQKKSGLITGGILNNSYTAGIGSIFSSTFNFIKTFNNDEEYLDFGFRLLQGTQDLKISSTPSIVTTNGEEGQFKVTQERIIGQEKTENSENDKTTYIPIFREAGVVFKVIPEILKDDYLSLKINIESSDFKMMDYTETTGNEGEQSFGSKVSRNIETSIKIRNGETVFIGGLKKGIIQSSESKLKYMGDIPIVGFFFKNQKDIKEITDLYIRLKVDIIENEGFKDAGIETFED